MKHHETVAYLLFLNYGSSHRNHEEIFQWLDLTHISKWKSNKLPVMVINFSLKFMNMISRECQNTKNITSQQMKCFCCLCHWLWSTDLRNVVMSPCIAIACSLSKKVWGLCRNSYTLVLKQFTHPRGAHLVRSFTFTNVRVNSI